MKKIKLVHIVYSFEVGGIETLLLSLLNGLDKDKYEIHLITLTNDKLKLISSLDTNIFVHSIDFNAKELRSLSGFLDGLKELSKLLQKIKPNIIHNHLTSFYLLFILIAMKISKIKARHIRTVHTAGSFYGNQTTLINKFRLFVEKIVMKKIETDLISVSNTVHKNNIYYFENIARDITLIANGVNLNKYDKKYYLDINKSNFSFAENNIIVSYVARFDYGKNHDFLIDLWRDVIKEIPYAILCFAGEGSLEEYLVQKTKQNNLEKSILFLGSIENVPELLSISDIAVFPSSFEGFSLVMLEKLAMKIPVVASDIEPFKEMLKDKENALLVSLNDKNKFAKSIIILAKDTKLRKEIGEKACLVAQKFSIVNTIKLHNEYYQKYLIKEFDH